MDIPLLQGWYGAATRHYRRKDVAFHCDSEGEGADVEKEEIGSVLGGGLAGEDTSLNGGTVGNGLVRVDALLELLAVEEIAEELLDAWDAGGATNQDNLVDLVLLETGVLENLLNGGKGAGEGLGVQVLEAGTGDVGVEVLAVEERVNLNGGLGAVGEGALGTLTSCTETTEGTRIARDI